MQRKAVFIALCGVVLAAAPAFAQEADAPPLDASEAAVLDRALADSNGSPGSIKAARLPARQMDRPEFRVTGSTNPDTSKAVHVAEPLTPQSTAVMGIDAVTAPDPVTTYQPDRPPAGGGRGSAAPWAAVKLGDVGEVKGAWDTSADAAALSATVQRSVPLTHQVSIAVQNSATVKEAGSALEREQLATLPLDLKPDGSPGDGSRSWQNASSVRLSLAPTGTAVSVSRTASSLDPTVHGGVSVDQKIAGPLQLSAGVSDLGMPSEAKSVTARFKVDW